MLGDIKYTNASEELVSLLSHENDRVKFYAAQALGRLAYEPAIDSLIEMLAANNDKDLYLRHAAILALSRIGKVEPLVALVGHEDKSLRIAAVLVLRRLQSPEISIFLSDKDPYIVTEAARAINDDWSIEQALPALAATLKNEKFKSEPLLRRAINAALRVGSEEALQDLIDFAKRETVSNVLRGEALSALSTWNKPSVLDRVDGRYRGEIVRDSSQLRNKLERDIPVFLEQKNPEILIGVAKAISAVGIDSYNDRLFNIFRTHNNPKVRASILTALGNLDYGRMEVAITSGMKDSNEEVRTAAVNLLPKMNISKDKLPSIVGSIFQNGSTSEQQSMLNVLGDLPKENTYAILSSLIVKASNNKLGQDIILDLMESVKATEDSVLIKKMDQLKKAGYTADSFQETLYGGNRWNGRDIFNSNPTAQCVRCHSVNGSGGEVDPALDNIANLLTREQILEALIEPSARLAPGYGTVNLILTDGQRITGVPLEEDNKELLLRTSAAEPMRVPKGRIKKRENSLSAMPAMGRMITETGTEGFNGVLRQFKRIKADYDYIKISNQWI
ncbi:HEAT repeat domain-containing protein [Maribacter litopenaei]|uniref:HEAT repeat domain-containing protein n=1 Tax=Maribacter litopenaei TaxID=2976127 RepID=A0ABY5Y776_9FLAO|nr:HEAT repeat domain-containing protein [Maribacter litopenaei]UWX54005.1 HEAT repeat domain-containing protein [Maribacter litopenaei]